MKKILLVLGLVIGFISANAQYNTPILGDTIIFQGKLRWDSASTGFLKVGSNGNIVSGTIAISDVLSLQTSLNGKAALVHTHAFSDLTGTQNVLLSTGSYSNPSWLTSLAFSKISSLPTTLSGYNIGDAVSVNGSYANPSFITSLAYSKITGVPSQIDTSNLSARINSKLNISDTVAMVSRLNSAIGTKANSTHTHTESQVTNLVSDLASKLNISDTASMLAAYGTAISNRSLTTHNHDSRYYTQSQITTYLAGKADTNHTHAISQVTGLSTALSGKQATLVSGTNIKSVNGQSLLGSGNIVITASDTTSLNAGLALKLNLSDTSSMLAAYRNGLTTLASSLNSGLASKLSFSDTAAMLSTYQTALANKSNVGHTHTESNIVNLVTDLSHKVNVADTAAMLSGYAATIATLAPITSPAFSGSPTSTGILFNTDSTTKLATTKFVKFNIAGLKTSLNNSFNNKISRQDDYSLSLSLRDTTRVEKAFFESNYGATATIVWPTAGTNGDFSIYNVSPSFMSQMRLDNPLYDSRSDTSYELGIFPELQTVGSNNFIGIWESIKETSTGSGFKKLIDLGVNSAAHGAGSHLSKFSVDDLGNMYVAGTITNSALSNSFTSKLNISDTAAMLSGYATLIAGKAPSSHTHTESQITNLISDLAGKAALSHTHSESDITNLITDLGLKAPIASPTFTGVVTLPNNKMGAGVSQTFFNTTDQITDFEKVTQGYSGNIFNITSSNGGLGVIRPIQISSGTSNILVKPDSVSITGILKIASYPRGVLSTDDGGVISSGTIDETAVSGLTNDLTVLTGRLDGIDTTKISWHDTLSVLNYTKQLITLLGYNKADKATAITINGLSQDLSTDRAWTIAAIAGSDTTSLSNRINLRLKIADTAAMLASYQTAINGKMSANGGHSALFTQTGLTSTQFAGWPGTVNNTYDTAVVGVYGLNPSLDILIDSNSQFGIGGLTFRTMNVGAPYLPASRFGANAFAKIEANTFQNPGWTSSMEFFLGDTSQTNINIPFAIYGAGPHFSGSRKYPTADIGYALFFGTRALTGTGTNGTFNGLDTYFAGDAQSKPFQWFNMASIGADTTSYKPLVIGSTGLVYKSNWPNYTAALALKLNISDTASMLSGYASLIATKAATSYVNSQDALNVKYTDTATMLSAYQTAINTNTSNIALKANIASPTFTGTVVLPSTTSIGTLTATELGYVHSVTSSIQTQLNGKAASSHTHVESDITNLVSDLAGKASSTHTHAESDVTNLTSDLALKAPLASPSFTGTAYAANLGVGVTSGTLSKLYVNNTSSSANNIGAWFTGISTASSGTSTAFAITPTWNETSTASNIGIFLSPYYQANGSGTHYLINAGTNTASNAGGTHTIKFSVDNAGNLLVTGNISFSSGTDLVTALAAKQPQLSGTGFVKASGTTISYDNTTYGRVDSIRFVNTGIVFNSPAAFSLSGNTAVVTQTLANQSAYTLLGRGSSTGTPSFLTSIDSNWVPALHSQSYYDARYQAIGGVTSVAGRSGAVTLAESDITSLVSDLGLKAALASPTFTGVPAAPTATAGTSTTQLATTAFVTTANGLNVKYTDTAAMLSAYQSAINTHTSNIATNTSNIALKVNISDTAAMLAAYASAISSNTSSIALKAPLASPTFTGTVVLPSTTSIGSTTSTELGYVHGVTSSLQTQLNLLAPLASPTFTGTPSLPTGATGVTQSSGDNTTKLATTAFVTAGLAVKGDSVQMAVFTSSGSYTIPAGARFVLIRAIGAGGGGSSGRKDAAGTARSGGGGGGAGGFSERLYKVSDLNSSLTITVGTGGTGGVSQTTNTSNGNAGSAGGVTTVAGISGNSGQIFIRAAGGGAGAAGFNTASGGGTGGAGQFGGAAGGASSITGTPSAASNSANTAGGGGGGGCIPTTDVATAGGGGASRSQSTDGGGNGAAGAVGAVGSAGGNGLWTYDVAAGAGGGGASTTGNAGAGGTGGSPGGGGGGGGAAVNAVGNSGAGGNGGNGAVAIWVYF